MSSAPGAVREDGIWLDDIAVGQRFVSGPYEVTEAEIVEFARRYDPQVFHLDAERAEQTFFGGLAGSGWMTAAITIRLLDESVPFATGIIGSEINLKWPSATRPGDALHVESVIEEIVVSQSRPDRARVLISYSTVNQSGEVRQDSSGWVLLWRKPSQALD